MKFDLTEQDAQLILDALSQGPYKAVHQLIPKIIEQARAQQSAGVASEVVE